MWFVALGVFAAMIHFCSFRPYLGGVNDLLRVFADFRLLRIDEVKRLSWLVIPISTVSGSYSRLRRFEAASLRWFMCSLPLASG